MMSLPKYYQHKDSSISGSSLRCVDCVYLKARDRDKINKYFLSVSTYFFVRVGFVVTTNRFPESGDVFLSIRVEVRATFIQFPESKDGKYT